MTTLDEIVDNLHRKSVADSMTAEEIGTRAIDHDTRIHGGLEVHNADQVLDIVIRAVRIARGEIEAL